MTRRALPPSGAHIAGDRSGVHLTWPSATDAHDFVAATAASRGLHAPWSDPPATLTDAERYLTAAAVSAAAPGTAGALTYLIRSGPSGELVGVVNANNIVRGAFRSTALGYVAFVPHAGRGRFRRGLALVLDDLFGPRALHRAEANVRPENARSRALVERLGFRHEGTSPRMLFLADAWRDHERYAVLADEWPGADVAAPALP